MECRMTVGSVLGLPTINSVSHARRPFCGSETGPEQRNQANIQL